MMITEVCEQHFHGKEDHSIDKEDLFKSFALIRFYQLSFSKHQYYVLNVPFSYFAGQKY